MRVETADLAQRIIAAAIRNGHTAQSFSRFCRRWQNEQLRMELFEQLENWRHRTSQEWVVFDKDSRPHFVWTVTP